MLAAHRVVWSVLCALFMTLAVCGCRSEAPPEPDDDDPAPTTSPTAPAPTEPTAEAETPAPEPEPPSRRLDLEPWRDLLADADRAELDTGGLWIDLASPGAEAYTLGAWTAGWRRADSPHALDLVEARALLALPPGATDGVQELVVRARSACQDARLSAHLGGLASEGAALTDAWQIVRLPLTPDDDGAWDGLQVHGTCPDDTARAQVDWLWLARAAGASPPVDRVVAADRGTPTMAPLELGGRVRRALVAPTARTWSWYLADLPDGATLVADHGSQAPGTRFVVRALVDGESQPRTLFETTPEAGRWREAVVDLAPLVGHTVRLELTIEPGHAADDERAPSLSGWGEPVIGSDRVRDEPDALLDPADAQDPPKHVVFIVIDTARADAYAPIEPDTVGQNPAYVRLAETSTVFPRAWNNANWTKPSVATMLTGLYPFIHGAQTRSAVLPGDIELLSEQLRAAGLSTGGFVANGFISERFGFERGWDHFRNFAREGGIQNAKTVYETALDWAEPRLERGERLFLYLQPSDPHVPYWVGRRWSQLYHPDSYHGPIGEELDGHRQAELSGDHESITAADYAWIRALYYGEVSYHDHHMGRFLDRLDKLGALDDALVIVTNDHGEELDDHGEMGHGHSLYEELLRAPLLVRLPGRVPTDRREAALVESIDVPSTVLDALSLPESKQHQGRSLFALWGDQATPGSLDDATAVATWATDKRAVRVGDVKLVVSRDASERALYDLADAPGEATDVAADRPLEVRRLERALALAHARPDKPTRALGAAPAVEAFEVVPSELDPELQRQLEALGYFGE